MDDLFSKISDVLKNPEALEQIKNLASGFGVGGGNTDFHNDDDAEPVSSMGGLGGFSMDSIQKIMKGSHSQSKNIALLHAITPYMRKERATKIDSAIKAIQVLSILNTLK